MNWITVMWPMIGGACVTLALINLLAAFGDGRRLYPDTPKAVVIGHSMGGLLAHLLICDSGNQFCIDSLGKSLSEFKIEPNEYKTLEGAFYFKASTYVAAAIFMATPHHDAELASGVLGRIGASVIERFHIICPH